WRETREGDDIRYTTKDGVVYAICLKWPGDTLTLATPKAGANTKVTMLGVADAIASEVNDGKLAIDVPALTPDKVPCQHAYVFKLTGVE
ncbi:MAG: hypothetical protein KJ060_04540, partial [Candidatus Hydrogenedentes bacterium]|nr:hypothetical protein [Candidatus Hydrogenedentota bacterium]